MACTGRADQSRACCCCGVIQARVGIGHELIASRDLWLGCGCCGKGRPIIHRQNHALVVASLLTHNLLRLKGASSQLWELLALHGLALCGGLWCRLNALEMHVVCPQLQQLSFWFSATRWPHSALGWVKILYHAMPILSHTAQMLSNVRNKMQCNGFSLSGPIAWPQPTTCRRAHHGGRSVRSVKT